MPTMSKMPGNQNNNEELSASFAPDSTLSTPVPDLSHVNLSIGCDNSKEKEFYRLHSGQVPNIQYVHAKLFWESLLAAGNYWPDLFIQQGHDAIHLADFMETMYTSRHPGWSSCIKPFLEQYKSDHQDYSLMPNDGHEREVEVMKSYMRLFDQLFFFGLLSPHTQLVIVDINELGLCYTPDGGGNLIICLRTQTGLKRLQLYITVLLHEMVHAFMQRFSCRCQDCVDTLDRCGKLGHGDAWCRIAYNVQDTAGWLLGFKGSLMIEKSYEKEVMACSAP